jgi:uncharacterized protein YjbJ (UPF0337 family)
LAGDRRQGVPRQGHVGLLRPIARVSSLQREQGGKEKCQDILERSAGYKIIEIEQSCVLCVKLSKGESKTRVWSNQTAAKIPLYLLFVGRGRNRSIQSALAGDTGWFYGKELAMDWNRVEGNWKQLKGKIKEQWGNLTDDDLDKIAGKRDQLEGKIQERYGINKDAARKQLDDWVNKQ